MCTLIIRHGLDEWCSTLIAANRDEFYDRPASGPMVLCETPRIVGGRDDRAGGTWFAMTPKGVFVGLTNQRSFGARDDALRSRGALVVEALSAGTFEGVRRYLEQVDARAFNEFNIIFGDGDQVYAAYGRRSARAVELEPLGPGVHVLCNDRLGSPEFPKADEARVKVESIVPAPWHELEPRLIEVLSDRSLPNPEVLPPVPPDAPFDAEIARQLQAICVKTPVYGTVSATLAALSPGRVEHYAFCDTAPDQGEFEDVTHLLHSGR
ncbi:MAG: NRDE family protein [Polyangiales bacterium]